MLPWLLAAYLVALIASHIVRNTSEPPPAGEGVRFVTARAVAGRDQLAESIRLAYRSWGDTLPADRPVVVLLHGSPGDSRVMQGLGSLLGGRYRVVAPDLPGFGNSTSEIPDYSVLAHSVYLQQLLDSLGIDRAHLVGFSMGGGVVLELADAAPGKVASLTMLSAIGVQEHELLGDYYLNHAVHGLQLAALWLLYEAVPHFGILDANWLNVAYARNFYDTDQRPLRGALERWQGPMLILHGDEDPLVPAGAAYEHERIVPQAELVMYDGDHFMTFLRPADLVEPLADFVQRVELGTAPTRATADPQRVARASQPFDPASVPPKEGFSLFVVVVLIAAATLVSEDLATISAGLLVARGSLTFLSATGAALTGIFIGDMMLFLAGRWIGGPLLFRAPLRWFIRPEDVERTRGWFARRGPALVLASRFLPGTRLPTYFTAGMLRMPLLVFTGWFLLATMIWTPILVAASVLFGTQLEKLLSPDAPAVWPWVVAVLGFMVVVRLLIMATSYRGRRLLLSRWRRLREWEFWPPIIFYAPILLYVLWLGIRHRGLTLFTAANPVLPDGGFVGESKAEILAGLGAGAAGRGGNADGGARIAEFCLIPAELSADQRLARANEFVQRMGGNYPVVVKPDVGERGDRVAIVAGPEELASSVIDAPDDLLLQEYAPGVEVGVFYYRYPGEESGRIFSVTEKRLQSVVGDGERTLEQLILADERAMRQASVFLRRHAARVLRVPAAGEVVPLGNLGNHCQGAVFLDGSHLITDDLRAAVDSLTRDYQGFQVGRYDFRAPSFEHVKRGELLTAIELNGVSSEATNIYDPRNGLAEAYGILRAQWRLIFSIGEANRKLGYRPISTLKLLRRILRHLSRPRNPATPGGTLEGAPALAD